MTDSTTETVNSRIKIALNWSERYTEPAQSSVLIALCVYMTTVVVMAVTVNTIYIVTSFRSKVSMSKYVLVIQIICVLSSDESPHSFIRTFESSHYIYGGGGNKCIRTLTAPCKCGHPHFLVANNNSIG